MIDSKTTSDQSLPPSAERVGPLVLETNQQLLHDLRVHQAELEMQNEELRRTQEELELSRARYFDLYDMAPVSYFTLSHAGLIQEANLTAAALLGVPRSAMAKQPLSRFILEADQALYFHHRRQLVETGARQVCELRMLRSGGAPCWVRFEATSVVDAAGVLGCRAVVSDITARRHAEETLIASEARHRILFEKSHDALMTLAAPDWRFTSGNSTTLRMFGVRDEATFLAQSHDKFWPEWQPDGCASAEKARLMIEIAMREGSHYYEWTYQRLSGQEFPATVLLTRMELEGKAVLQATVRDETEVKRLQAMLRQSDRLASMGMLAASVAHEINNPLTYVLYNIESLVVDLPQISTAMERCLKVLRAEIGDDAYALVVADDAELLEPSMLTDVAERSMEAREGAQRIQNIAKAIGTFSRLESTRRSRVDLNSAIESAVTMARTALKARAKLVVDFGQLPPVWASEGKLSQVFLNLLINAAQAIEEGSSVQNQVEIHTWSNGDDVVATVTDTGKGVPKEHLARIFDPFFTTKPTGVGSGLGLCICRNIVTDFGGDISVESEPGEGTRFVVRLPVQKGAALTPKVQPASEWPAASGLHGRILVVDDEPAIRTMLANSLGVDHEVITAESGEEARAVLDQDQAFDVILCDLMMLEMTGMDLHAWLVAEYPALAEQVVFISGGAFTPRALEYVQRVGNRLVSKPFEMAVLERLVSERVSAQRKGDVAQSPRISAVVELRARPQGIPAARGRS